MTPESKQEEENRYTIRQAPDQCISTWDVCFRNDEGKEELKARFYELTDELIGNSNHDAREFCAAYNKAHNSVKNDPDFNDPHGLRDAENDTTEEDYSDDRSFQYGDIVGAKYYRKRAALPSDELYIVITDECRAVGHTHVEVIPFSACTSRESALQHRKCVDVAYLKLKLAADDRKLFTVTEEESDDGEVVYNVLAPNGDLAASFHDFEGSHGMAEEFADRFCDERNEACLLEDNGDYELIFPTEAELEQLEYTPTYEQ